jgi:hypothetical protein
MFGRRFLVSQTVRKTVWAALWRIFHQIKGQHQTGRKISIEDILRRMRRLEEFLYSAANNSDLFFKMQDQTVKKLKQVADDSFICIF